MTYQADLERRATERAAQVERVRRLNHLITEVEETRHWETLDQIAAEVDAIVETILAGDWYATVDAGPTLTRARALLDEEMGS